MRVVREVLSGWFKGPGNQSYEAGRFLWFISVLAGIVYCGVQLHKTGQFNVVEYGTGLGALLAAGGFGIKLKDQGSAEATKENSRA